MMKPKFSLLLFVISLSLLLAACGEGTPVEPTQQPAPVENTTSGEPVLSDGETVSLGNGPDVSHNFTVISSESEARYVANEEFFADALSKYGIQAGWATAIGITPEVSGNLQLNFGKPGVLELGEFIVDVAALRSDRESRDNYLQDNALESGQYPEARFTATSLGEIPDTYTEGEEVTFQLIGDLTVRDVTRPATFEVTAVLDGDTIRGTAAHEFQLTDFGIEPPSFVNTLTVANEMRIEIDLVAQKME